MVSFQADHPHRNARLRNDFAAAESSGGVSFLSPSTEHPVYQIMLQEAVWLWDFMLGCGQRSCFLVGSPEPWDPISSTPWFLDSLPTLPVLWYPADWNDLLLRAGQEPWGCAVSHTLEEFDARTNYMESYSQYWQVSFNKGTGFPHFLLIQSWYNDFGSKSAIFVHVE